MRDSPQTDLRVVPAQGMDGAPPPLLDHALMDDLRRRLGAYAFEELYEDAVFEITERLAAIEAAMKRRAHARVATLAEKLSADAKSIGFARCAAIAQLLSKRISMGNIGEAPRLADRLISVGEDSLIRFASVVGARWRDSS